MDKCTIKPFNNIPTPLCPFIDVVLTDLAENITRLVFGPAPKGTTQAQPQSPLKYTNLVTLIIGKLYLNLPPDFFSKLHNLQNLTLLILTFKGMPPEVPSSATFLQFSDIISEKPLDMSKLYDLQNMQYSSSGLSELPPLASTAPINFLDLSNNTLTNLKVSDIAQYCLLKNIDLSDTNIQKGSDQAYCELAKWFINHEIEYALSKVNSPPFSTSVCSAYPEDMDAKAKYNKCKSRGWWKYFFLVVASILILSLLIAFGVVFYLKRWSANASRVPPTTVNLDTEINEETQEINEETQADTKT